MDTTILAVFAVVYLGMILGGLPFLQLDRTGVALLGAIALIAWRARGHWELAGRASAPDRSANDGASHGEEPPRFDHWQTAKGLSVAAAVFMLFLFTPLPREVVALTAAGLLMMSRKLHSRKMLALASTLAGNLLIVGSIANIIVVDAAERHGIRIDWKRHARIGIPVTLATMAISWLYLWYRILPAAG